MDKDLSAAVDDFLAKVGRAYPRVVQVMKFLLAAAEDQERMLSNHSQADMDGMGVLMLLMLGEGDHAQTGISLLGPESTPMVAQMNRAIEAMVVTLNAWGEQTTPRFEVALAELEPAQTSGRIVLDIVEEVMRARGTPRGKH